MAGKPRILVVDDEVGIVEVLRAIFRREGYRVKTACDAAEALEALQQDTYQLMVSDIRMEPVDGIQLLAEARELQPHLAVIMMTAYAAVETAVEAMRKGAFDYICKPFKVDELLLIVQRALNYEQALAENATLKETLKTQFHFSNMIGDHECMRRLYSMVEKVARTESTIMIRGESGTGKELVARAIHASSPRADRPFVAINCAAVPATLLESELFGYVKGAFTGANRPKKGFFEAADGGTLFLDEVGSIPISMQLSLLRALQEHEVRPVGASRNIAVDVRIVAATNEDLEGLIREGRFREDLYYRLSVIPVELPPLRDRLSDVPLLVAHFLARLGEQDGRELSIAPDALAALNAHAWPGNVRELENVVSRAGALCDDDRVCLADLPDNIGNAVRPASRPVPSPMLDEVSALPDGMSLKAFLKAKERAYIQHVLGSNGGDKERAAKSLGISLATFYRKYGG
ncbi:MAG: sigma-54-dependent Fis family transcriptional regulator [Victivallales bacterium]|nr:sigma-54-dependent Fis family transcriptional regulator [Victivallales bacterium]MBT7166932.1 sigma-54-dependent Fis family transcriptional regulator [Victivallales bacterium]MBT7299431.1 sigma-54-dependent Fis family transcriptional regulator [Victivallales bacterium]